MNSDEFESLGFDIDLFFHNHLFDFHFATAGGYVPRQIFSAPNHKLFRAQLLSSNAPKMEYIINPNLDKILSLKFESQKIKEENFNRNLYLSDFILYATKGCFSFDRTFISNQSDIRYHLVAYPFFSFSHPLHKLNEMIREIVKKEFDQPIEVRF